jgi:PAS domain S-box-containing protein
MLRPSPMTGGSLPSHQAVLEQLPAAVVVLDREGRICYWNGGATRLFGWTAEEVLGASWTLLVPEGVQGRVTPVVESVLKGTGTTYVKINRTKDGRTVICEWRNAPIRDERGNIVGVIAIAHSVLADGTASYAWVGCFRTPPSASPSFPLTVVPFLSTASWRNCSAIRKPTFIGCGLWMSPILTMLPKTNTF